MASIKWLLLLGTAAAAACTSDSAAGPPAPPCNAALATDLALAVGAYTAIDPAADSGCVSFPANASLDSAEYVVVAQSAGGVPGDTALFALQSTSPRTWPTPTIISQTPAIISCGRRAIPSSRTSARDGCTCVIWSTSSATR